MPGPQPSEHLIFWIFTIGIFSITLSWITIPVVFVYRNKVDDLFRLVQQGSVIKFITVTYIVLVVVTLGLIGRLEPDKISTLLAAILGYILGEAGGRVAATSASPPSEEALGGPSRGTPPAPPARPSA